MENNVKAFAEFKNYEPHFQCHEDEFYKEWMFDVRAKDKNVAIPYSQVRSVVFENNEIKISAEDWFIQISGKGLKPIYNGLVKNNLVYVSCAREQEHDNGKKETYVTDILVVRL